MNNAFALNLTRILRSTAVKRGAVFGGILIVALLAFEVFNYSTTAFALTDVLGDLQSAGLRWATILALAFCGIDFAGLARLFTPQQARDQHTEVWYLFGAWLLAASFNALLTWWGVSVAILHHTAEGSILVGQLTLTRVVPVLVAVMVWMIRVLIIGTFSLAGENMFSMADDRPVSRPGLRPQASMATSRPAPSYPRPAPKPVAAIPAMARPARTSSQAEPTYHPIGLAARPYDDDRAVRQ